MSQLQYGLKLPDDWTSSGRWRDLCGPAGQFGASLARWGVDFVELSTGENQPGQKLLGAADPLLEAGLGISVHPYVEDLLAPEAFAPARSGQAVTELLDACDSLARACSQEVVLICHGGLANLPPHRTGFSDALQRGHEFFRWTSEQIRSRDLRVRLLSETQVPYAPRDREHLRVGDTWRSCMDLVADTGARICWDFGHTWISAWMGYHHGEPGEEFLSLVGHVHAHDVVQGPDGLRDHRPLGEGSGPWGHYLRLLRKAGYSGRILFELDLLEMDSLEEIGQVFRRCRKRAVEGWNAWLGLCGDRE